MRHRQATAEEEIILHIDDRRASPVCGRKSF